MTPEALTAPRAEPATLRLARIAGLLYLVVIASGLFAEVGVRTPLVVAGDAEATSRAIAENASLWRWGLATHLLYHLPAVALYALLYQLFRPAHAFLARAALLFGVVSLTVEAIALLHLYVPLLVVAEGPALAGLGEQQLQAMTYLSTQLFSTGWAFGLVHFAGFCVATGLLIAKTGVLPRAIGWLLIAAGICYLVNSLTYSFMRDVSDVLVPWILLPALVGEASLALWLTTKGTNGRPMAPVS